jgi:Na+/H+-translocating membrane pyrophosphatase
MESTGLPVIIISIGVLSAYYLGEFTGITDKSGFLIAGLFGTAIATMVYFFKNEY